MIMEVATKMEDKSSNEILDEMFRELEAAKSAHGGGFPDTSDFSIVLGSTLVNDELAADRSLKRKKNKHKHSKHKSKKSKKHKSKSRHSSDGESSKKEKEHKKDSKSKKHKDSAAENVNKDEKVTVTDNKHDENGTTENDTNEKDEISKIDVEGKTNEDVPKSISCTPTDSSVVEEKVSESPSSHDKNSKCENGDLEDGEIEDDEPKPPEKKKSHKKRSKSKSRKDENRDRRPKLKSSVVAKPSERHSGSRERSGSPKEKRRKTSSSADIYYSSRSKDRSQSRDEKIDKAKLLEIARKNTLVMLSHGSLQKEKLKSDQSASIRAGGKSVEELTDFCKLLSDKEKEEIRHRNYTSDEERDHPESEEEEKTPFHHPFIIKEPPPRIVIKSGIQLQPKSHAEKTAEKASELRLQFPVSSGTQHRSKEWVPVVPKEKEKSKVKVTQHDTISSTVEDKVFPDSQGKPSIDIGSVVSDRLKAIRALQDNPYDVQALGLMYKIDQQTSNWAAPKPGQYVGSTDVQLLTPQELAGPSKMQAWVRKDQFQRATPVHSRFGLFMLQKMGWKPGEGLGKNKEGTCEPLNIEIKLDKKGLVSEGEIPRKNQVTTTCKDLSAKHPVSALVELCNKRKWLPPDFNLIHDSGPDHRKNFLFKVHVNGVDYQPTIASLNKKHARAQAATVCLQSMGLLPRDVEIPS